MSFTVGLPGGTRDYEFEAYVRLLEKSGVNVARTSRVVDPVTGKRWLHAWTSETEAEEFATDLRNETENSRWKVYRLPEVDPVPGPLGPIDILVSRRSDGCTYSLSPTSRKLVLKSFPSTNLAPSVFVASPTQFDFETVHGPIWDHVAIILTGLSLRQIEQLSGYRVIDPTAKKVLHDSPLST